MLVIYIFFWIDHKDTKTSEPTSLTDLDRPTGILHVWFLLLEGVCGATAACPRNFQPATMETLFELLRAASHIPGRA